MSEFEQSGTKRPNTRLNLNRPWKPSSRKPSYPKGLRNTNHEVRKDMKPNTSTTPSKLHVAVLFGGRSGEHEVSLMSARSVLSVLDPAKYDVTQVGITPEGTWLTGKDVLDKFESKKMDG